MKFGFGSSAAGLVSLESVDASAFFSAGCFFSDVDDDSDPDVVDGSADATPCPTKTAAPIPRATANPPIRPTYAPAPIPMYLPLQRASVCDLAELRRCLRRVKRSDCGRRPRKRRAKPARPVGASPRRGSASRVRLDSAAGTYFRRSPRRPEDQRSRRGIRA